MELQESRARDRILKFIKKHRGAIFVVLLTAVAEIIIFNIANQNLPKQPELNNINNATIVFFGVFLIVVFVIVVVLTILSGIYKINNYGRKSLIRDSFYYRKNVLSLFCFFKDAEPYKLKTRHYPKKNWKNTKGILFGYTKSGRLIYKPSNSEINLAVYGSPGSSKTVSFVKPNARRFGGSVLAVDIKGDIYQYNKMYRNIIRFAPDIPDAIHQSAHFNPFACIPSLNLAERKLFASNMSEILIPDDSKEKYFSANARKLFCGILLLLLEVCPNLTFPEFLHAVLHYKKPAGWRFNTFPTNVFEWIEFIAASPYPQAVEQVAAMIGNNEKNISGVADRLNTALVPFTNEILDVLLDGKGDCISAETLYNGNDVYLQISQMNLRVYAPLFTLILNNFMTDFANRPDSAFNNTTNRPVLCILDEFPQLTFSYYSINQFLSTLRSKSVIIMLVCQTISQLAYKYGNDGYQALIGNCTCQVCCKSNDPKTIDYFQTIIGTKKVLKRSDLSISEANELIYDNPDFGALDTTAIVYLEGYHIKLLKIKSYE